MRAMPPYWVVTVLFGWVAVSDMTASYAQAQEPDRAGDERPGKGRLNMRPRRTKAQGPEPPGDQPPSAMINAKGPDQSKEIRKKARERHFEKVAEALKRVKDNPPRKDWLRLATDRERPWPWKRNPELVLRVLCILA